MTKMIARLTLFPQAIEPILRFVDQFVPHGSTEVWLTGSRAKWSARPALESGIPTGSESGLTLSLRARARTRAREIIEEFPLEWRHADDLK
jgi:hypothetical protein